MLFVFNHYLTTPPTHTWCSFVLLKLTSNSAILWSQPPSTLRLQA